MAVAVSPAQRIDQGSTMAGLSVPIPRCSPQSCRCRPYRLPEVAGMSLADARSDTWTTWLRLVEILDWQFASPS